ncbi:doublecortin domain-containing protein 2B isoform X2 [Polypterus senegalus]|uniref:doublecortin domain-containing protein 2B isoform X2 n=1 Tax=Polypterus senegalus TaxID=55291 RepID=UPI001963F328|nr:doublecortin domain-containing protein 2B isoform X2 [Polypterus senegalus]
MTSVSTVFPPAKNIIVYKNGDPFFNGRKIVVNQKQFLTYESFLNEVTGNIHAPTAIRNLYTPKEGHRVHELNDLQNGCHYVAAGFERFKKLDYLNPGSKKAPNRKRDDIQIQTVYRLNVSAKWRKQIHMPVVIFVFRNGDLLCPAFRLIIPKNVLHDWEKILIMVTEKANLRTGAVQRLCTVEGVTISSGDKLESGQYCVAVGTEKFKHLPYIELLVPKPPAYNSKLRHAGNRRFRKKNESDIRRVKSTGATDEPGITSSPPVIKRNKDKNGPREEDSIFYAKPVRVRKHDNNSKPSNKTEEEPGVFRGNQERKEAQGAREVPEDENTRVELPLDERVAETVDDELIAMNGDHHSLKKWNPLQRQRIRSRRTKQTITTKVPKQMPEQTHIQFSLASKSKEVSF